MNQTKIAKALARSAVVSWREQPTQFDIEALRANTERVGLVIRVRWAIVAALAAFSIAAATIYGFATPRDEFISNMTVPAIALVFVLMYNGLYQITYRRIGNIAYLNQAQLLFDMVVTSVLVYYSGGVYSWFAAMYLLFILEGAFILPRRSHVWLLVGTASVLYGIVLFGEYLGWFPHVDMPFLENNLHTHITYVLVRYLWNITLFGGAALVGMLMMRSIRKRETELQESSFVDELTGLFNRLYFQRTLATESERARRNSRSLGLLLADVDHFGEVNRTFGVETGDAILASIARLLRGAATSDAGSDACDVNTVCRIGGEELALIVPEVARSEGDRTPLAERVLAIAERFRAEVERSRVSGVGVTVSVGVALSPDDGESTDALMDAADGMLSLATGSGGNVVRASWLEEREDDAEA